MYTQKHHVYSNLNTAKHTTSTDHCSTTVINAHLCSAVSLPTTVRPRRRAASGKPYMYHLCRYVLAMCYLSLS